MTRIKHFLHTVDWLWVIMGITMVLIIGMALLALFFGTDQTSDGVTITRG